MPTLVEVLAGLALVVNAVIYGTDVFCAIVVRPALAAVDDRTLTQAMGHIHRVADVRLKNVGVLGLLAAAATAVVAGLSGHWVSVTGAVLATLAELTFIGVYTQVSKPVNVELTVAATAERTPPDARGLQTRWDSVIDLRVALHTLALAALCLALAAA